MALNITNSLRQNQSGRISLSQKLCLLAAGISCLSFAASAHAFETKARNAILMDYETGAYLFTKTIRNDCPGIDEQTDDRLCPLKQA